MKLPPIDDVIKALEGMGLGPDDIAKTIANMGFNSADNVASKVDEVAAVIPKVADRVAEAAPKLIPEGEALPAAVKMAAAPKKPKLLRPKFDDVVHAKTTQKFSDIMTPEEYAALPDDAVRKIRNSELNKANNEELRVAGAARKAEKKAANKAAHAATRTPEARKAAAAQKAEFYKRQKEGWK
jgi:hypothetical protein